MSDGTTTTQPAISNPAAVLWSLAPASRKGGTKAEGRHLSPPGDVDSAATHGAERSPASATSPLGPG